MKKTILLLMTTCLLFSCQKETDVLLPELTSESTREYLVVKTTEPYADKIWNTCLNEYVAVSGTVTFYTKESHENGYYLDYQIDLDKAIGIGEVSGTEFKGGGRYEGKVKMDESGLDVQGKVYYNVSYHSPGGNKMGFTEHATFMQKDGVIKVQFNNQDATCE